MTKIIPQKFLITGGAGFIGSHTVDLLLSQDKDVTVYDNFSTGKKAHLNLNHPRLKVVDADILDSKNLSSVIAEQDAVLHLAALASVPESIENPVKSLQTNVQGFLNVLQSIRQTKKKVRLVYASSAAVYGNAKHLPCDDRVPLTENILSPYALEKITDERYAKLFSELFSINSLGLRYFNVYGERQDPHSPYSGVISKFISLYRENKNITVFGDGKQSRDFIHVKDIARANVLALHGDYCGVLNIATGKPETLLNLLACVEAAGKHSLKYTLSESRAGDIRESYASVQLAKIHLGFSSTIDLLAGIAQFFEPKNIL